MSDFQFEIDDSQSALAVDQELLSRVIRDVLEAEGCEQVSLSLAIVDDATIHELNHRYLDHDGPTDVLSFLFDCQRDPASPPVPADAPRGTGKRIDGEIVVSAETALHAAVKYRWRPEDELTLYVVHGLLHLCGYDDRSTRERKLMRKRERELLAAWKLKPHYDS